MIQNLSIKILWAEEDELFYLVYLIDQYLDPVQALNYPKSESEVREFSRFVKSLIILNAGLENESSQALTDFIENFQQLYPHLFNHTPVWVHWMTEAVESEFNRGGGASC